jgi:tRNA-splicing endonuclease subunit Sen2
VTRESSRSMSGIQESVAHGHAPEATKPEDVKPDATNGAGEATQSQPSQPANKRPPRRRGPNYAQIHSKPLPLDIHPLPAFHPTHPTSLLRLAYAFLSQLISPPTSHPESLYIGYFSPESRSVHITDPAQVRALWEMGFFGKGTLSRSEPSWLEREKAKSKAGERGRGTAEEATRKRREERRLFKLERARLEAEKIEHQRAVEEGRAAPKSEVEEEAKEGVEGEDATADADKSAADGISSDLTEDPARTAELKAATEGRVLDAEIISSHSLEPLLEGAKGADIAATDIVEDDSPPDIENQEHLQLTLEEAFFLSFGLGVLNVQITPGSALTTPTSTQLRSKKTLLSLFSSHATFPPTEFSPSLPAPDSAFMLSYVTYHHFRSLGWVVRAGTKFGVDYLLYNRGPVFSHAEFAIMIMPSYSHEFWQTEEGKRSRRIQEQKDWWWLHCVNRVQSQVKKSLVLCYVEIPPPVREEQVGGMDVATLLKGYKVREFVIRRWLMNRSRG